MTHTSTLMSLFGHSPIKPLQNHMQSVVDCVLELVNFFESVGKENWVDAGYCYDELVRIEKESAIIKQDIRLHLPNTLFTPIAR